MHNKSHYEKTSNKGYYTRRDTEVKDRIYNTRGSPHVIAPEKVMFSLNYFNQI